MSDHVKEYRSRGKTYFYFRPPDSRGSAVRLRASSREEAAKMAAAILATGNYPPSSYQARQQARQREREGRLYRRLLDEYVGSFLLMEARRRAVRRKMAFDIDAAHIAVLLKEQNYRCAITGLLFEFGFGPRKTKGREPFRPSIDRVDTKVGYVSGNCRIVLVAVNIAMSTWGEGIFLRIARAAVERQQGTEQKPEVSSGCLKAGAQGRN